MEENVIKPQKGFQEAFLSSPADIVIGGGAAGAGKTYVLIYEPVRNVDVDGFGGVIFRRTTPQIRNEGGLWDTSSELYSCLGATPKDSSLTWVFRNGNKMKFSHLEHESDILNHQGAQYCFIGFDELTQFTKKQFFYLLGRNRSMSGVSPYMRATCNPDPDSWVAEFIAWWINQETGYPIPERSGILRYFTQDGSTIVWGDSYKEVIDKCPHIFKDPRLKGIDPKNLIKSLTFIPGSIYENKILIKKDPSYLGNLLALDEAEKLRLFKGNWKVRQDGSSLFDFVKVTNLFSNFVAPSESKYITCDYARFGSDFCVIFSWVGFDLVRIEIFTKSSTTTAFSAIEKERERLKIPRSNVAIDEGGVGGGVMDLSNGEYIGITANASALPDPITKEKENYDMLKTQLYYRTATRVNSSGMAIKLDNIIIDGSPESTMFVNGEYKEVKKLISEDLRAIRKRADHDGPKKINTKEQQKNILGRSPDFGDAFSLREYFEVQPQYVPQVGWL